MSTRDSNRERADRDRSKPTANIDDGSSDSPGHGGGPPPGSVVDRRVIPDRRALRDPSLPAEEGSDFSRRRGPGRRLSDFTKSAEEGHMTKEQFLFLVAIDEFKKANNKAYPTWTDVLEVIRLLGYRKTMPTELTFRKAEDWLEAPSTPSGVRAPRWHEKAA